MKTTLIAIGVFSILISLIWGLTQDDFFEPWSGFIGIIFSVLGYYLPNNKNDEIDQNKDGRVDQENIMSSNNESHVTGGAAKQIRQTNFLSFKNKQSVTKKDK